MVLTGSLSNSYFSYDIHIIFIIKKSELRPVGIGGSGDRAEFIQHQSSVYKLQTTNREGSLQRGSILLKICYFPLLM